MKVGSLFAGIGGFDLGFERAGMETAWFCEQDEFCQRVLAKHWPGVPCYPDITKLRGDEVEPVDVLCGGFPCQDLSVAGKGAGLDGARSGLWSEYARLVGELRPRYVVVENVRTLRSRGLHRVLEDLAALGYDAEWDCIPASGIGAPHQRDRIWLVAYPQRVELRQQPRRSEWRTGPVRPFAPVDGEARPLADARGERRERRAREQGARRDAAVGREAGGLARNGSGAPAVADADQERRDGGTGPLAEADGRPELEDGCGGVGGWWLTEPDVGRVADGVPARLDRLRALGNALVPQIAEWIGHRIVDYEWSVK